MRLFHLKIWALFDMGVFLGIIYFNGTFREINHPDIGIPPWPSKPGTGSSGSSAGSGVNLSEQHFRGSGEGGLPPKIWTLRSETVIELYEQC